MKFYSTNNRNLKVSLKEAVLSGLSPDNGLFMPEFIPQLPETFFDTIENKTFQEIAFEVSKQLFGDDINEQNINEIITNSFNFEIPLKHIHNSIYSLELFHGPTLAFKDVGARFMAQLLRVLNADFKSETYVLVATSGDTGSAVANGFLNVPGIKVIVLYPSKLVSDIQEKQFTTLGKNITALEINGTFDDCQHIVKQAFLDKQINNKHFITSANSINVARFIPQSFYYFWGYTQLPQKQKNIVISVPSGNFGNLTAGLLAKKMGLPIHKFISATNANDIVPQYLLSGNYEPKPSVSTIANAMDVGNPSNFARILDMYGKSHHNISKDIEGISFTDNQIKQVIKEVYKSQNYLLDPHGAIGYMGLKSYLDKNENSIGFFIETAHPAKFNETVEEIIEQKVEIPPRLHEFMKGTKQSILLSNKFEDFKEYMLNL